jgi:hypothetical protein
MGLEDKDSVNNSKQDNYDKPNILQNDNDEYNYNDDPK